MMLPQYSKQWTITNILIVINVIIYILLALLSGNIFMLDVAKIFWIAQYNLFVFHYNAWYELFTSLFVHFDIIHLLSNMFFLYIIGNRLETFVTPKKYLIIYFLGGLVGNILSLLLPLDTISAGASGAIFSIFSYLILIQYYFSNRGYKSAIYLALMMFLINIGFQTNLLAHFGGMATGLILGYLDTKKQVRRKDVYTIPGVMEYY